MKKLLMLLMLAMCFTTVVTAQMKKNAVIKKDQVKPGPDSMTVRFTNEIDTTQLRIIVYMDDHTMGWVNGYMVNKFQIFSDTNKQQIGTTLYYDEKFVSVKIPDILTTQLYNWK